MANLLTRRSTAATERQVAALTDRGGEADPNGRQQRIPVAAVKPNPRQPRKRIDQDGIVRLAANIQRVGLLNPITVRHSGDGEYELMAGQRRLLAHQHLGEAHILARVFLKDEPTAALIENLVREDLDLVETAVAIRDLMESEGIDDKSHAADLLGMERTRCNRILGVLNLPKDVLLEYQGMASDISASKLFEVASAGTEERQRQLWELAKSGLGERELREAKKGKAVLPQSGPERPALSFRPLPLGRTMLGTVDRLARTLEALNPTAKGFDDQHRAKLAQLRESIDRLLNG
jgi:ParB family chromosome partitioning protein